MGVLPTESMEAARSLGQADLFNLLGLPTQMQSLGESRNFERIEALALDDPSKESIANNPFNSLPPRGNRSGVLSNSFSGKANSSFLGMANLASKAVKKMN